MTDRVTIPKVAMMLAIFVVMAGAGYAVGGVIARRGLNLPSFADVLGVLLAFLLAMMAATTAWLSGDGERFKRNVEQRDDSDPVDPRTLRSFRMQSGVCALAAILLAAPIFADGAGLLGGEDYRAWLVVAVMALLLGWQTIVNYRIWREGDELIRTVLLLTGAITFAISQIALFAHAALVRLGLMQEIGAWGLVMGLMAIYLTVSTIVSVRMGFGRA